MQKFHCCGAARPKTHDASKNRLSFRHDCLIRRLKRSVGRVGASVLELPHARFACDSSHRSELKTTLLFESGWVSTGCCEPAPILLCMGLFSQFCVQVLRCTAEERRQPKYQTTTAARGLASGDDLRHRLMAATLGARRIIGADARDHRSADSHNAAARLRRRRLRHRARHHQQHASATRISNTHAIPKASHRSTALHCFLTAL